MPGVWWSYERWEEVIDRPQRERKSPLPSAPIGLCETFTDYEGARKRMREVLKMDCDARLERVDGGWEVYWRFS